MRTVLFCDVCAFFGRKDCIRTGNSSENPSRRFGGTAVPPSPTLAHGHCSSLAGFCRRSAMWLYKSTSRGIRRSSEAQPTQLAGAPGSPPLPVPWVAGEITDLQSINQALIDATSVRTSNASSRSSMQSLNEASTKSRRGSAASVAAHAVRRSSMMLDDAARKGSVNIAAGQGVLRF